LGAEAAGLFGIAGAVGILFAPIAGKIGDRRGPADLIVAGAFIMLASWLTFAAFGTVAGLIVGVILLDFGEQAALVSTSRSSTRFDRTLGSPSPWLTQGVPRD
jgi:MFS family permease